MSTTLTTVYEHSKNLSAFRSGTNWFIGVTARKHTELLDQLTPLAESGSVDAQRLEAVVQTFLNWFREKYRQAQQQDCTYDDSEIVESVGILAVDETGKIRVEVLGRFQFWSIKKEQIDAVTNQMSATDATFLVADPKHTDVVKSVKQALTQVGDDELSGHLTDIYYPFALLKTSSQKKPVVWNWYVIAVLVFLTLAVGSWMIWQKSGAAGTAFDTTVVHSDTKSGNSSDTFTAKPTRIAAAETPPNQKTEPPVEPRVINKPASSPSVSQAENKPDEPQPNQDADHFYEEAERSLSFARASIADGKNKKALGQLEKAIYNYQQYLVLKPDMKALIRPKLREINQKRSLIESSELELD